MSIRLLKAYNNIHEKLNLFTVFLSLPKAFNTVGVDILLDKDGQIGVRDSAKQQFCSHFSARTQYVNVNNKESRDYTSAYPFFPTLVPE